MNRVRILRGTALFIALVQFVLGLAYLFAPEAFNASVGLAGAPAWTAWPFAMMGARFIFFGFGMVLVFLNPVANRAWIQAMIGVQAIDWLATVTYVASGVVSLAQVSTASFLPLVFIAALLITYPRNSIRRAEEGGGLL